MADAKEEKKEPKERKAKVVPQKPGDKDSAGYELVKISGDKSILKTPKGRYAVYVNAWGVGGKEECLLRPVASLEEAEHFLSTGKKMEKPAPEKKAKKEKAAAAS